jgi:uncharacterized protein YndB with AHSA1/START domain
MTHDLRFARLIGAPPERVFDAFTTAGGQVAFYGQDDPGWIVQSSCDLRVGGVWNVEFGPHGTISTAAGTWAFPTVELRDEHRVGLPNAFARLERAVRPQDT